MSPPGGLGHGLGAPCASPSVFCDPKCCALCSPRVVCKCTLRPAPPCDMPFCSHGFHSWASPPLPPIIPGTAQFHIQTVVSLCPYRPMRPFCPPPLRRSASSTPPQVCILYTSWIVDTVPASRRAAVISLFHSGVFVMHLGKRPPSIFLNFLAEGLHLRCHREPLNPDSARHVHLLFAGPPRAGHWWGESPPWHRHSLGSDPCDALCRCSPPHRHTPFPWTRGDQAIA